MDDIVTRLRGHAEDEAMLGNDWLRDVMRDASDEIERLRTHMDVLVDHNVELMAKVASLEAVINGRLESTSITQAVRGD